MADFNGTAGADLLFGAATDDVISGGDGNDTLIGGAGDDLLLGGEGDDVLLGETGDDRLEGGAGDDTVQSTDRGDDSLFGGDGNDELYVDRIAAGDSLLIDGGAGSDRIVIQLSAAADLLASAGEGDDSVDIFAVRTPISISLGAGRDLVTLINLRNSLQAGGQVTIGDFQAAAGDRISFSSLTAFDFTGWNPDTNPFATGYLKAVQSGADVVISASLTANGVFVDALVLQNVQLGSLTADHLGGWTWDGSAVAPLSLTGTSEADTLRGNGAADEIFGLDGDDVLEGHAGADILWGGEGNDTLRGGAGADQLHGGSGNDVMSAESAGEGLYGEDGDDRLTLSVAAGASAGSLYGSGGAGNDTIGLSSSNSNINFGVDAGAGDDIVNVLNLANTAYITLGDGRDRLDIDSWARSATNSATIEVLDFATGDGGDRFEWTSFLLRTFGSAASGDLFAGGYLRLLQSGADTLLQMDRNGGGDQFATLVTFKSTNAADFTAFNLGGFPEGSRAAGTTVTGTADRERLSGTDGDDIVEGQGGADTLFGLHGDDTLRGGEGNDTLNGYDGDDVLEGGAGNDTFSAGRGDDLIDGGDGNDLLDDRSTSGATGFVGGAGDDDVLFSRFGAFEALVASGDAGDDYFSIDTKFNPAGFDSYLLDGGAGNDLFEIAGDGKVTLGAGSDMLRIMDQGPVGGSGIVINDFEVGDSGDRIGLWTLTGRFTNFDRSADPFATGHLKLVQAGADTLLQADFDGPATPGGYVTLATLIGVDKHSLTSVNIGGYELPFKFGTAADETFQGNQASDEFTGGGGNDTFLIGYGGDDVAVGGAGDDLFFVATGLFGPVRPTINITGGGGNDTLQIQSKLSDTQLTLMTSGGSGFPDTINATGISTVQLLSGFDSSRGWALGSALRYFITVADGFAPAGAPLIFDTTRLAASESFFMEVGYIQDQDAFIKLIGGEGVDHIHAGSGGSWLDGGGGQDEFYSGVGDDTLLGGGGDDNLHDDVGYSRSGTDFLDGGDGDDVIELAGGDQAHWTSVTILGGSGDDFQIVNVQGGIEPGIADIDLGSGNDRVQFRHATGTFNVTLGEGRDTVEISTRDFGGIPAVGGAGKNVTIRDFQAGSDGDFLNWAGALNAYLAGGYAAGQNPFRTGHARLVQDGGDVLLQVSRLADGSFLTLLRLQNHLVADFDSGLGGFDPKPEDGTAGGDVFVGGAGNDDFDGKAGDDSIDGGAGADRMTGGLGNDTFFVDDNGDRAIEAAGEGVDEIRTSLTSYSLLGTQIENLTATSDIAGFFRGSIADNVVTGGGANDQLRLQDGGNDTARGGAGNDVLYFGKAFTGADLADGGEGRDAIVLQGNYTLTFSETNLVGIESVSLQSGANANFGDTANNFYDFDVTTADGNVAAGQQLIVNAQSLRAGEDFTFDGSAESDGRFLVYGGHGTDSLTGGDGVDVFFFEGARWTAGDRVDGGDGRDSLVISGGSGLTHIEFAAMSFTGIESISVNNLYATDPSQKPSYELVLHNGNVAPGATLIVNGSSIPAGQLVNIDGRAEMDGNLILFGGGGHDTLFGGAGADLILGGGGADALTGGAGADTFRYDSVADSVPGLSDLIGDFQTGVDRVDLSRIDADSLAEGDQAFSWIGANAFSGAAGELRVRDEGGYRFIEGDVNGDGSADFSIAFYATAAPQIQSDFIL